jgi:ataxia telangiectasia mutated family protein
MRHYFIEKHKTPITWFAMRLNYTHSVATTSIVGHILGLGDCHVQNILIDNGSGEVMHIDLGIAFDQVRSLCVCKCLLTLRRANCCVSQTECHSE